MEPDAHVGEAAHAYAIGALDAAEHAAVDAHVAACAQCLRLVGEAEETVLALERGKRAGAVPSGVRRLPFERAGIAASWVPLAAAAAFVLGLLLAHALPQRNPAALAMIGSHFEHAQFSGTGPPAKVIFARDRSWYYVLVAGRHDYEVDGIRAGRLVRLGSVRPNGETSQLFSTVRVRFDALELRDRGALLKVAAIR